MRKFVVVDLETTGHTPKNGDRIIQFAAVVIEERKIVRTFTTYINPETEISPFITELTGINQEMVQTAPVFKDVAGGIVQLFDHACFVAHNVQFDFNFLQEELKLAGIPELHCPVVDTVEMSKILMPTLESYKLTEIAETAGFNHDRPHRADSDAFVTAEWFLTMLDRLDRLPAVTLKELRKLSVHLQSDLYTLIDDAYEKKANNHNNRPDPGIDVYRGIALKKRNKRTSHETAPFCARGQVIQEQLNEKMNRSPLFSRIFSSLQNGELAMIEQDPSLESKRYSLAAAVLFSLMKNEPVLLAASTIHNQQRLLKKVVPLLKYEDQLPVDVQILKGRNHYLNLWKFEKLLKETPGHYDEVMAKMQILVWLTETDTGDLEEINFSSGGREFLRRLSAAPDSVSGDGNPWESYDFYTDAVERAQQAQIVVTNHAYLLSDLSNGHRRLGSFNHILIDDAHLFATNASKQAGLRFRYRKMKYFINQFDQTGQQKLLGKTEDILRKYVPDEKTKGMEIQEKVNLFSGAVDEFFLLCISKQQRNGRSSVKVSVALDFAKHKEILYSWERVYAYFSGVMELLEKRYEKLLQLYRDLSDEEQVTVDDLGLLLEDLLLLKQLNEDFTWKQDQKIIWLEYDERSPLTTAVIHSRDMFIDEFLSGRLYLKKKAVLFLSHALTVDDSFQYMADELGLGNFPVLYEKFQSNTPAGKVGLYVMDDLPDVNDSGGQEYVEKISAHIISIATVVEGKVLVLFNSMELLKKAYSIVKESGALDEFAIIAQGVTGGSVNRLTKQFGRFEKALFFATNSYLVNPGLANSPETVIMTRLPFTSPDEPVFRKKSRFMQNKGKNPFFERSLPEAVLKFKAGFNQFYAMNARRRQFIVFDRRIYSASYGYMFLRSLPDVPVKSVDIRTLCREIDPIVD